MTRGREIMLIMYGSTQPWLFVLLFYFIFELVSVDLSMLCARASIKKSEALFSPSPPLFLHGLAEQHRENLCEIARKNRRRRCGKNYNLRSSRGFFSQKEKPGTFFFFFPLLRQFSGKCVTRPPQFLFLLPPIAGTQYKCEIGSPPARDSPEKREKKFKWRFSNFEFRGI